jgi:hypothetical protein
MCGPFEEPDVETQLSLGLLEERVAQLEAQRFKKARTATAAHDRLQGETISKYWSEVNKSKAPRDALYALEKPNTNPVEYETKPKIWQNLPGTTTIISFQLD